MSENQPIHPDIPLDRAWQAGRRIYIRCGYHSQLNTDLVALGAHWDGVQRARWVGAAKKAIVVGLVQAAAARQEAAEAAKQAATDQGLWLDIPYGAMGARELAKQLRGRFDGFRKAWAMPTPEAKQQVEAEIQAWRDENAALEAKLAAEDAERAARYAATARQRLIDDSGRTLTGEAATVTLTDYTRMDRWAAAAAKPKLGTVLTLADGRRGLVITSRARFVGRDDIDAGLAGNLWDDPHWEYIVDVEIVEPTGAEALSDAANAAAKAARVEAAAHVHTVEEFITSRRGRDTLDNDADVHPDVVILLDRRSLAGGIGGERLEVNTGTGQVASWDWAPMLDVVTSRWTWTLTDAERAQLDTILARGEVSTGVGDTVTITIEHRDPAVTTPDQEPEPDPAAPKADSDPALREGQRQKLQDAVDTARYRHYSSRDAAADDGDWSDYTASQQALAAAEAALEAFDAAHPDTAQAAREIKDLHRRSRTIPGTTSDDLYTGQ